MSARESLAEIAMWRIIDCDRIVLMLMIQDTRRMDLWSRSDIYVIHVLGYMALSRITSTMM
jgi:hypothetical protein